MGERAANSPACIPHEIGGTTTMFPRRCTQSNVCGCDGDRFKNVPGFAPLQEFREVAERVVAVAYEDARGCRCGKLEARVPEFCGRMQENAQEGDPQAVQCIRGALQQRAQLRDGEHQHRAYDCGRPAGDRHVHAEQADCDDACRLVGEACRLQEHHEHAREQNHMEAANREDMHEARTLKIVPERLGNAAPVARE